MQIRRLQPAVYIYCKDLSAELSNTLEPLMRWGGELRHIGVPGPEGLTFLLHILRHYRNLPDRLLLSQKIPEDGQVMKHFEVFSG